MEPKTTGKRIVSKRQYGALMCKKAAFGLGGIIVGSLAIACLASASLKFRQASGDYHLPDWWFGIVLLLIVATGFFFALAGMCMKQATKPVDAVPFTHANTAHLPAPDTLVRASEEPVEAQEAVLLRAAAEGLETPPEQLVRAVNGQE